MVTMPYEWQAGKWLFQGLMASVLSGVGFVVLTLAFEYGKRYRRERREREQQVILEKLLRGDVVLEWNNPKAIVPVNNGCVLRDFSSSNRGSFLINNYKQRGGFLGVGRGYYANRNKPEEDSNSEIVHTDKKMVTFSNYNTRIQDSSQPVERGNKTPEPTVRTNTPDNASLPEIKEEARIFQSMINSQSAMSISSNRIKESVEPAGQKDASQPHMCKKMCEAGQKGASQPHMYKKMCEAGQKDASHPHMCKKMCEEMCYRIVKEHPFIAPFIRRDLLQELPFDAAAEPKAYNSGATGSGETDAPKQWTQIRNAFCQAPKKEPSPKAVKCVSKIKKRARSMSRCPQSRMRTTPIQLEKRDSLIKKTASSGVLKKADLTFSKRPSDIKSEYQKLNSTTNTVPPLPPTTTASKNKLLKNVRSRRSFSLCRKIPLNNSEPISQNLKFSHNAKVTKECTADVYDNKFTENGEKGSSVDPLTASSTTITEHSKARPVCKEQTHQSGERQLAVVPVKEDSECTSKQSRLSLTGADNKNSSEGRIIEIVSALASWGYSIKNKVQGKEIESATTLQEKADGGSRPGFNILSVKDNVETAKLDSKALIDLIKNLAGSRKHRKLLRQISSVLDTNNIPERMSRNSKSFTRTQASPLAATSGIQAMVKSPRNIADSKAKKTSSNISDTSSRVLQDIKKGPVVKRRRIVRERSYLATLSSVYKKESDNKIAFYQTPVLQSNQSKKLSSPRLENEQWERQRHSTSPKKRHRKSPKSNNLKKLIIKKMEPRVLKKPTSKTLTRRLNSSLHQGIPTERDRLEVVVRTLYGKDYAENSSDQSQQSQLETQCNTELNNRCNNEVETTQLVVQTYQVGEATQLEETESASENDKQFNGHDDSDGSIYQNNQKKRRSQTSDLWITNDVISCRFSPSPAINVNAKENRNACVKAPNRNPAKNEDAVSETKDFTLSAVKETSIRTSVTINRQRKAEKQTEQRHAIFTRTQSKHVASNKARKSTQINASDFFSEMHTFNPAQRTTYAALSKPVAVLKSNSLSKLPPSANKRDNRRLQHLAETAERHSVSVNCKTKEDPMRTFVKSGKKIHNEGIKSVPSKTRENSQVASKTGRQKPHETRSRFEQYQKNKLIKNATLRNRTSAGNKKTPTEPNQTINRTTLQNMEREAQADKNKTSDIVGELQTVYTSPVLPPALITHTNCSVDSATPKITGNSLELESTRTDYRQMVDSCISFENDPFEPQSDGEDAWETNKSINICQQSFNILKKSKLDIVVSSMLNAKSTIHTPAT